MEELFASFEGAAFLAGQGDLRPGESDGDSDTPAVSADGRFVAFASDASNLVSDDTNFRSDVFVTQINLFRACST